MAENKNRGTAEISKGTAENKPLNREELLKKVNFDDRGLMPAVLQDAVSGRVLMLAYMNRESLERTLAESRACFYSRSRQKLWLKGETSGNYQRVEEIRLDCDGDTLLLQVSPEGPACHTGEESCFYRRLTEEAGSSTGEARRENPVLHQVIPELEKIILERRSRLPEGSYTAELFKDGPEKIVRKLGEEVLEVILAALTESQERTESESADLLYHLLVLLAEKESGFSQVQRELGKRFAN